MPLPANDTWLISFSVATDEDLTRDPTDTLAVYINEVLVGSFANDPGASTFPINHAVQGDSFTYRFEFSSGNSTNHLHMRVNSGTATPTTIVPALGAWGFALLVVALVSLTYVTQSGRENE